MAYPIKSNFKDGAIAVIRGRMWNAVARICSFWASGNYITVKKPEHPSGQTPIVWDLDCKAAAPEIAHEFYAQGLWPESDRPLLLRAVLNAAGTTVTAIRICLPANCLLIKGEYWSVNTSHVTAVSGTSWYTINSRTSGAIYLVESSTTDMVLDVANAAPTDKSKFYCYIGSVLGTEVVQNQIGGVVWGRKALEPTNPDTLNSGCSADSATYAALQSDEWEASDEHNAKGLEAYLCFRGGHNGSNGAIFFRKCKITSDGRIFSVAGEESTQAMGVRVVNV